MKLTNTKQLISFCAAFSLIGAVANAKKPEEQAGYDKSKDLGVKAPDGADTPFDGTMKSVKKNWEMWPKSDMDITIAGTLADNYPVGALVARSATGGHPAEQGDLFVPRLCRPRHAVLTSPEAKPKELEKPLSESSESYSARVLSV